MVEFVLQVADIPLAPRLQLSLRPSISPGSEKSSRRGKVPAAGTVCAANAYRMLTVPKPILIKCNEYNNLMHYAQAVAPSLHFKLSD